LIPVTPAVLTLVVPLAREESFTLLVANGIGCRSVIVRFSMAGVDSAMGDGISAASTLVADGDGEDGDGLVDGDGAGAASADLVGAGSGRGLARAPMVASPPQHSINEVPAMRRAFASTGSLCHQDRVTLSTLLAAWNSVTLRMDNIAVRD
jgi:hypothetical protein